MQRDEECRSLGIYFEVSSMTTTIAEPTDTMVDIGQFLSQGACPLRQIIQRWAKFATPIAPRLRSGNSDISGTSESSDSSRNSDSSVNSDSSGNSDNSDSNDSSGNSDYSSNSGNDGGVTIEHHAKRRGECDRVFGWCRLQRDNTIKPRPTVGLHLLFSEGPHNG